MRFKTCKIAFSSKQDGTYTWEHLAEQLKKLLQNEIPKLKIPPLPSKIYTVKNQPILGDASSDVKKLQEEFDKEESEKMEVIVDSLGLIIQPDEMPELDSLKGSKIRKLFVYKEDDNGELQSVKWCVGTVKDIGQDPDGLDVADIVWDDKFVENPEDKETCEFMLAEDWNALREGGWQLA